MNRHFINNSTIKLSRILCVSILASLQAFAQTTVSTVTQLNTALNSATAGSTIILKNGIWKDLNLSVSKGGSSNKPVTIKAESVNGVSLEGNFKANISASCIVLDGFTVKNPSTSLPIADVISMSSTSTRNRFTNLKFENYNSPSTTPAGSTGMRYITLQGSYHEVDHCSFIGKTNVGSCILVQRSGGASAPPNYHKIHHNLFSKRRPEDGTYDSQNDQDAMRIGDSNTSQTPSYTEIYDNLFDDWVGEIEIISSKACNNKIYNNTFSNYAGALTLRHGKDCEVYGNFFFANPNYSSGGIRVMDENHKVYNNYISGVRLKGSSNTGGINITNGRPSTLLNGYYQVKNAMIVNNTMVDCEAGILIGTKVKSDLTLAPENITISNNIIVNTNSAYSAFKIITPMTGTNVVEGNSREGGVWDINSSFSTSNKVEVGLLSATSTNGFRRIVSTSKAVNTASGTFSFLTQDITLGTRTGVLDRGCEEFSSGGTRKPLTIADVGISIGQLVNIPTGTMEDYTVDEDLNLGPNPFNNQFAVSSKANSTIESIQFLDSFGKTLNPEYTILSKNKWEVNTENLTSGIYYVKVKTEDGVKIKTLIKQ